MNWCLEWEGHCSPGAKHLKVDLTAGLHKLIQRSLNQRIVKKKMKWADTFWHDLQLQIRYMCTAHWECIGMSFYSLKLWILNQFLGCTFQTYKLTVLRPSPKPGKGNMCMKVLPIPAESHFTLNYKVNSKRTRRKYNFKLVERGRISKHKSKGRNHKGKYIDLTHTTLKYLCIKQSYKLQGKRKICMIQRVIVLIYCKKQ